VSNTTPAVDGVVNVTATVSQGGQPVPNGTAVQFVTTLGLFTEANATSVIRTTTNGIATVTLTSSTAGLATITATVGNASATAKATFTPVPPVPPPPNLNPTITSVVPSIGRPQGNELVTITGTNFANPKVVFDFGNGKTVDAFLVSVNSTKIQVLSPAVDLGAGQQKVANIVVINNVGTPNEVRVTAGTTFTFQAEVLTPSITTVSPTSGPIDGGTRVTIFGEGFQAPLQVFFGSAEAPLAQGVQFNQLVVTAPKASDTLPDGSGVKTGPVDVKIINITSNKSTTAPGVFRYIQKAVVTAAGPTEGPFTGGTRMEIDGTGFNDPVTVTVAGVGASVQGVFGSKIVVITSPATVTGCSDITGPIVVTNIDNGDQATGPIFTYRVPKPVVVSASPATAGGPITIVVANAVGLPRLRLADIGLTITNTVDNGNGTTTFTAIAPTTLTFQTQTCPGGGTAPIGTAFDVTFESGTTGCTNTLNKGAFISPPNTGLISLVPQTGFTGFTSTAAKPLATPPVAGAPSAAQTVQLVNTGAGTLTINSITQSGCGNFAIGNPSTPATLNSCDSFPIVAQYTRTATTGSDICTLTISTNVGTKSITLVGTAQ